jgi:hypothetical protein
MFEQRPEAGKRLCRRKWSMWKKSTERRSRRCKGSDVVQRGVMLDQSEQRDKIMKDLTNKLW